MPRRSVAVVPFGARSADPRAGAWGRQIARRLVDRFADHASLELKPVFLVAMADAPSDAGYLVFGSTPEPSLAAQYGASLGTSHALVGVLRADGAERAIEATLVDVAAKTGVATLAHPIPAGALAGAEAALAAWLSAALQVDVPPEPAAMAEPAYAALLEGLDEEVNATLLAASDARGAADARGRAAALYLDAVEADPAAAAAEERLLVLAAESLERGDEPTFVGPLERLTELAPRSWRGHYLLGELRRLSGDPSGAVVALEHADALHPLGDGDSVRLAELYLEAGAETSARSRLRRIKPDSQDYAQAQDIIGVLAVQRGDLAEAAAAFERAVTAGPRDGAVVGRLAQVLAANGDLAPAIARYREALMLGASADARLGLARALVAAGHPEVAATELETLLGTLKIGETAAHARRLLLGLRRHDLEERLERAGRAAVGGPESELAAADAELAQVIAVEPDLWEAHFAIGLIARRRGDAAAAERALTRVLELWPEQPDALHELGVALLMAERTTDALPLLDEAARLRPEDAGYLADAGFAQLRAGNLHAARERLMLASELDADDPITQAYLQELARLETAGRPN
ncbi:MAG TPA: tetratricopeptide repeat protein [Candidatus Limnocylindria bacterium]|nr:tetratricopeptide repeat protein [Candidatus Limnocylindria bacterium]